jgi:branched-subunit amino acid permease
MVEGGSVDFVNDLAFGLLSGLAYALVGLVLLALGYGAIDLITPGRLGQLIYVERNANAAAVVASGLVAIATIVTTAILTSHDELGRGLASAGGFGLLGVALLVLSFLVVDRLTPGDLGDICTDDRRHPAVLVTVANYLAVGAIVAAAIS